jgi:hypothetical protein
MDLWKQFSHDFRDLMCEKGRNRIANLVVLLGAGPFKEIVVRECLKACGFTDGKASTL